MRLKSHERLSILTLTVKNIAELNKYSVRRVRNAFNRFRRRKYLWRRIKGGIWAIEVKGTEGNYNLHIHCLIEHSWFGIPKPDELPQRLQETKGISSRDELLSYSGRDAGQIVLSAIWEEITGDPVVHIKGVGSRKGALRYSLKYCLKPPRLGKPMDYVHFLSAFFSVPLIKPFGSWYNHETPDIHFVCPECGSSDFEVIAFSWFIERLISSLRPP